MNAGFKSRIFHFLVVIRAGNDQEYRNIGGGRRTVLLRQETCRSGGFYEDADKETDDAFTALSTMLINLAGCSVQSETGRIPVQVLILPKFEVDEMSGDFPSEGRYL